MATSKGPLLSFREVFESRNLPLSAFDWDDWQDARAAFSLFREMEAFSRRDGDLDASLRRLAKGVRGGPEGSALGKDAKAFISENLGALRLPLRLAQASDPEAELLMFSFTVAPQLARTLVATATRLALVCGASVEKWLPPETESEEEEDRAMVERFLQACLEKRVIEPVRTLAGAGKPLGDALDAALALVWQGAAASDALVPVVRQFRRLGAEHLLGLPRADVTALAHAVETSLRRWLENWRAKYEVLAEDWYVAEALVDSGRFSWTSIDAVSVYDPVLLAPRVRLRVLRGNHVALELTDDVDDLLRLARAICASARESVESSRGTGAEINGFIGDTSKRLAAEIVDILSKTAWVKSGG